MTPLNSPAPERRAVLVFLGLGLLFWGIYCSIGSRMESHGTFRANDLFFNSDTNRILGDMCVYDKGHKRSNVHPLFVLFLNPIGVALTYVTGTPFTGALVLNSFIGGTAIGLAGAFFYRAGLPMRRSLLLTFILGLSAAHLFFGSSPETFALSALSIIILFHLALRRPSHLPYFIAAGVFSFGVLLTNLAFAGATFLASSWQRTTILRMLLRALVLCASILFIAAALATVQKRIWPSTRPFYFVKTFQAEERFMDKPQNGHDVFQRELLLLRHVFVFDWVAPVAERYLGWKIRLKSGSLSELALAGQAAAVLWLGLLSFAAYLILKLRLFAQPIYIGFLLCLLINLVLHTLYGDDLFLYSCNTCFLVLSLVGLALSEGTPSLTRRRALDAALASFLLLEIANNREFLRLLLSTHV